MLDVERGPSPPHNKMNETNPMPSPLQNGVAGAHNGGPRYTPDPQAQRRPEQHGVPNGGSHYNRNNQEGYRGHGTGGGGRRGDGFDDNTQAGELRLKFGDSITSRQNAEARSNFRSERPKKAPVVGKTLADWKSRPIHVAKVDEFYRPYMGRCCDCMPNSSSALLSKAQEVLPFRDVLVVPTASKKNGIFIRWACDIWYTWKQRIDYGYPNLTKAILGSSSLKKAILEVSKTDLNVEDFRPSEKPHMRIYKKVEKSAKKMLKVMQANMWLPLIKFTGWFLLKVLRGFLRAILVHNGQMSAIQKATQKKVPLIFVPTHRSHLDYVLITFILWHFGIAHPYVASGDNLNLPIFGSVLRSLGGFFIRRKIDRVDGQPDLTYRAVLSEYIEQLLGSGQNLEFFIEGGRSRSGKSLPPKAGLLSIVVDSVLSGKIKDAYIVPVSISYEKLLDGNFTKEQLGQPKKTESFWRTVCGLWRIVRTNFGMVRVDFCQPFSLQEFLNGDRASTQPFDLSEWVGLAPGTIAAAGEMNRTPSALTINGLDVVCDVERRQILPLAQHIVCDGVRAAPVMCTGLLCFALCTLHRQGVLISELVTSFDWLRSEIRERDRDLGFTGTSLDVILYSLEIVRSDLVRLTAAAEGGSLRRVSRAEVCELPADSVTVMPQAGLPEILELTYYSNQVMSVFQKEAVVACSVYALCGSDVHSIGLTRRREFYMTDAIVLSTLLAQILQFELFFTKPCENLETLMTKAFHQLAEDGIYILTNTGEEDDIEDNEGEDEDGEAYERAQQRDWARRVAKNLFLNDIDNGSDTEEPTARTSFKLQHNVPEAMAHLRFYQSILGPVIEAYWSLATHLPQLRTAESTPEADFLQSVQKDTVEKIKTGRATYVESCSLDMLKNCIRSLRDMGVVEIHTDEAGKGPKRMVRLAPHFGVEVTLNRFIALFESFKSA